MLRGQDILSADEDLRALAENIGEILGAECDRRELHHYFDRGNSLDHALWTRAIELSWVAIGMSEEFGGLGFGWRGLDVLFRSLGRSVAPGPFRATLVAAQWLSECAPREVAGKFIEGINAGRLSFGIPAVPGGAPIKMEGGRISGESDVLLIYPWAKLAILPVSAEGKPGFAVLPLEGAQVETVGIDLWDRTSSMCRLKCNGLAPATVIDDPDGRAVDLLRRDFALAIALDCVGGMRSITEQTVCYLKEREQFGRPLASFQALKHRVANLYVAMVEAEQLVEHAIDAAVRGSPSASMWALLAKAAASDAYRAVAADCMQLHGGVGFTWSFDCHIFLKRALLNRQLGGDNNTLRDLAVSQLADATVAGISTADFAA